MGGAVGGGILMYWYIYNRITLERIWVEVNNRVNYPIKRVLIDMLEKGEFSLDDPLHCHCVSWFSINVANVGLSLFISSWNDHPIPGAILFTSAAITDMAIHILHTILQVGLSG